MRSLLRKSDTRAFLLGTLSVVPMLVWWAGWFPGLMSSDSVDQYRQAVSFEFSNFHPITHTASMWLITAVWESPGAVTLVQVLAMAAVLGVVAMRLFRLGVPLWAAVGAAWLVGIVPMVAVTTITVWKDVGFATAMVWAFTELLALARDRTAFWASWGGPARLGTALGLVWALRSNGFLTVLLVLGVLVVVERRRLRRFLPLVASVLGLGVALPLLLSLTLPVSAGAIEPAEVFASDLGAVVVHAPDSLDEGDRALITAIAPIGVWTGLYDCTDSTPLVFDDRFDTGAIRSDPWPYRALVVESVIEAFPTVAGHRWCAADYLVVPFARTGSFLHYPPFDLEIADLGVERRPLSDRLFAATLDVYQWIEQPGHWWLTWRPALVVLAGIATWIAVAARRRLRPLLIAGSLFAAHLVNVAATTPAQEFRYAFPLYLMALLGLPLWWLVVRPGDARISEQEEEWEPSVPA